MTDLDKQTTMINDCIRNYSRLSSWEKDFINNLNSYTTAGGFLSDKQNNRLTIIWKKVML